MNHSKLKLLFLLAASCLTFGLAGCGGSGSSASTGAASVAKTALWANVTVRAMDGMVNIQWDNLAGASSSSRYNIYSNTDPSVVTLDPAKRIATGLDGRSFDHTGLKNGTRYYYVITEVTAAGEGPASSLVSATPQAAPPAAPFGPKVTAVDATSVKLEFAGPTPPAGSTQVRYDIYRSTTNTGFTDNDIIASGITFDANTPYQDSGGSNGNLQSGTTYYYALKTVIGSTRSGFSPVVSATPQAAVTAKDGTLTTQASFASPTGVWAQAQNGAALIGWTDVPNLVVTDPGATTDPAYILYWSDTPDVIASSLGQKINPQRDQTSKIFTLPSLSNGTTYYIQLAAAVKDANGNPVGKQTPGPVVAVTPTMKTPVAPASLAATQIGADQIQVACRKDLSGLTGVTYNVYFSTTDYGTPANLVAKGERICSGTSAYCTHSGLASGSTYYYAATAVAEGESAPSAIVSVTLAGP
jgi:hypothetical protein